MCVCVYLSVCLSVCLSRFLLKPQCNFFFFFCRCLYDSERVGLNVPNAREVLTAALAHHGLFPYIVRGLFRRSSEASVVTPHDDNLAGNVYIYVCVYVCVCVCVCVLCLCVGLLCLFGVRSSGLTSRPRVYVPMYVCTRGTDTLLVEGPSCCGARLL
jgi:hypothetical protein